MASFCMQCGERLIDGEEHSCRGAAAGKAEEASLNGTADSGSAPDGRAGSDADGAGAAAGLEKEPRRVFANGMPESVGRGNGSVPVTARPDGGSGRQRSDASKSDDYGNAGRGNDRRGDYGGAGDGGFGSAGSGGGSGQQRDGSAADFLGNMTSTVQKVDRGTVVRLLQNPFSGLQLDPAKDFVYGLLGLAASLIGFLIWALLVGQGFGNLFTFGVFGLIDGKITGRIFLIGLISLISLICSMWISGLWQGRNRQDIMAVVCRLGSMQTAGGAGFVIAGILALVSLRLSFVAYGITALVTLIVTVMGALELFDIAPERRFSFIGISVSLYWILTMLLAVLVF